MFSHSHHLAADLVRKVRISGDQDTGSVRVVLRLGKNISGNNPGIGGVVCDDPDLARAGREVDLDMLPEHHLRQGDVNVPRADDFLHRGDALCSKRHRGNSLGASGPVDLAHPGKVKGNECHRADGGWRAGTYFSDAGDPGGDGAHEGGRGICSTAPWNVEPDTVEGCRLYPKNDPGFDLFQPEIPRPLELMEVPDPIFCIGKARDDLLIHGVIRRFPLFVERPQSLSARHAGRAGGAQYPHPSGHGR